MRLISSLPAIALCLVVFLSENLSAQMPPQIINAERAKILKDVKLVPRAGLPGPIAIWGSIAFPLISAPNDKGVEIPVAGAAGYGKGRIILFGHNSYIQGTEGGDLNQMLLNCVRWATGKEKPRVGVRGSNDTLRFFSEHFNTEQISGKLEGKTLRHYDVVILNAQSITDEEEGKEVEEWIKKGGGVISAMTGWAYSQTSGGKDLTTSHGLNKAFMNAGIAFTDMSAFGDIEFFQARIELPVHMNASAAVTSLAASQRAEKGAAKTLTEAEDRQATNAIQIALTAQPPDRSNFRNAVLAAIGGKDAEDPIPTKEKPLTQKDHSAARIRLGMATRVLKLSPYTAIKAHPAHEQFPGKSPGPDKAPRQKDVVVPIDTKVRGWASTGLYAPAGELITVVMPEKYLGKGYSIRIGCHTDSLYHHDNWHRAPDISKSYAIEGTETPAVSAFGGLIYIDVPGSAQNDDPFEVKISGGILAPYFVLGKDDDAKWNSELKKRPAPWAELACDKMIISVPQEVAKDIKNPTELMQFWKKVVEAQDDLVNNTQNRRGPERMVPDVQISAGFMHSGYPIMVHLPEAAEMATYNRLKFPGWGFYHEIGHNLQRGDFTFSGTGEVTNNVLAMYVYEAVLGKDFLSGHPGTNEQSRQEKIERIKSASDKWSQWTGDPFMALTTYVQLIEAFGWESCRKYLYSFEDSSFGERPKNDDEKRDQFLVRYSKITGKNLGPFFDAWGIPVSSEAKAQVSNLPTWMPIGL